MNYNEEELQNLLMKLFIRIKGEFFNKKRSGEVKTQLIAYQRMKVTKFEYNEKGISQYGAQGVNLEKKISTLNVNEFKEQIKKTQEYQHTLRFLDTIAEEKYTAIIDQYTARISEILVKEEDTDSKQLDNLISVFHKYVRGEQISFELKVEIEGLIVYPIKEIEYEVNDTHYQIRQTIVSDLEHDILGFNFIQPKATAILIAKLYSFDREILQKHNEIVDQIMMILHLFKVSSIQILSYTIQSESFETLLRNVRARPSTYQQKFPYVKARLTSIDAEKIKQFWRILKTSYPQIIHPNKKKYIMIAYKRYQDALSQDLPPEGRIASIIMGLEALFLMNEPAELSYRLRVRISKVLSYFNYDPLELIRFLGDAYTIRSNFVHGGLLTNRSKDKLVKRYGELKTGLIIPLFDILRKSMLLFLTINSKRDFLELIDNSLINKKSENQLLTFLQKSIPPEFYLES